LPSLFEESIAVDVVVAEDVLRPEKAKSLDLGPVHIHGVLDELGGEYLFRGTVSGAFKNTCDRCLDPMEASFAIDVTWLFEEGAPPEAEGGEVEIDPDEADGPRTGVISGMELDLAPLAWEEIALAVPSKFLCAEDCAGLCPGCGANLNREPCGCSRDQQRASKNLNGLAGLADMFPDLKPDDRLED